MERNKLRKRFEIKPEELTWKGNVSGFPEKIQKILVIQTAFLGDLILTTPLFSAIKEIFPQAKLDVVVIPQTKTALMGNPDVNRIISFNKKGNSQDKNNPGKRANLQQLLKKLKAESYDMGIIPHRSFTTTRLVKKAKVKIRIGYDQASFGKLFYQIQVKRRKGVHEIQRHLDLLAPVLNIYDKAKDHKRNFSWQTKLFPSQENWDNAHSFLSQIQRKNKKPTVVALAPGSVYFTKKWPEDYFASLIGLLEKEGIRTILLGGPEDEELCKEIAKKSGQLPVIAAGKSSILDSAAIIKNTDLLYSNDSAPQHLANAMGTPVVSFFGPTSPIFGFYPYQAPDIILEEKTLSCQPCRMHGSKACPKNHFLCMKNITPQMALEAGKKILQNSIEKK